MCLKCEEKFGPNHKCKNKQFRLLILDEDEIGLEEEEVVNEPKEPNEEGELVPIELSMAIAMGLMGRRTLKLKGETCGRSVFVLIDCGAMHNFMAAVLVEELKISTQIVKRYAVTVGNGRKVFSNLKCWIVELEI